MFTLSDAKTDKNSLYRTVWKCSNCTETDTNIDSHWVLYLILSVCVDLGLGQCECTITFKYIIGVFEKQINFEKQIYTEKSN